MTSYRSSTLALTTALLATLYGLPVPAADRPAPPMARPVAPAPATPTPATPAAKAGFNRQEIRAQLLPRRFTTIAAEIGAKINRLPVPEGGAFKAGQLLVSFDCSVPSAMLQKARAELSAAQLTHGSNKRLFELNSVGKLELDVSAANVNKASAEVGAQQAVLSKCAIGAPFGGRVAEQKAREQQFVQPGQALIDILDDSVYELEFLVPSAWLGWLKIGAGFQVEIDETRKTYPAKVIRIGARVDPVSQSIKVAAAIDGKFPELVAGMSGRVQLQPPK